MSVPSSDEPSAAGGWCVAAAMVLGHRPPDRGRGLVAVVARRGDRRCRRGLPERRLDRLHRHLPCATGHCPTIDVAPAPTSATASTSTSRPPTSPPATRMRVAICSASPTVSTDPTDPSCLNGEWEANTWAPTQVPIAVDPSQSNLTQVSLPVFSDPAGGGDSPLPSHDILNSKGAGTGFYCDNAADPCALEVTEEVGTRNDVGNGPPVSTANTAIFPLTFVPQSSGCPSSDPTIQTDSSFSLEHFIPRAVDATCQAAGRRGGAQHRHRQPVGRHQLHRRGCFRSPSSTIPAIRPSRRP